MKRWLGCLLVFSLFFALLPQHGYAAELTLEAPSAAYKGAALTIKGTAPGQDVIITIKNGEGEILFFDTQKVVSGSYQTTITVPVSWPDATYRVTAIAAGSEVVRNIAISTSSPPQAGPGTPQDPGTGTPPVVSPGPGGIAVVLKPVVADGKATAAVNAEQLAQALALLEEGAAAQLAFRIEAEAGPAVGEAILELPRAAAELLWSSEISSLAVETSLGLIVLDRQSLQSLQGAGSGDIRLSIATVESGALSSGAQTLTGGRPVVDITVRAGDAAIKTFGGGTLKVGIPYALGANEDPNAVVIYYMPEQGAPVVVPNGFYDAEEGRVFVSLKHLSRYGVGVNKISFADVTGWSTDYITYLAARGIINGVGSSRFAPAQSITRAEFAAIIARMSEAETSEYTTGLFADVQAGDWFAPYVQWAYESGVANGTGNGKFDPGSPITREQMAVMLSRYAAYAGYSLPKVNGPVSFTDRGLFSGWAEQAIGELQQAGVIDGVGGNRFNPKGLAKREEAAKMIAVLLQGMSR